MQEWIFAGLNLTKFEVFEFVHQKFALIFILLQKGRISYAIFGLYRYRGEIISP